ncbi:MAG: copper amine oxidase N-terminal domain-containing protein [Syntrophomonadaceae bacterium]|nr:copper amine oxidase N-terminal domain-containing protein [Syntrophomonadaceae bacterium]
MHGAIRAGWRRAALAALLVGLVVAGLLAPPVMAETRPITVRLNGEPLRFDTPPQVVQGRTLVPLRSIFEALGVHLEWQQATKTVIGTKGGMTIVLKIGDREALRGTQKMMLDVPPMIINGRTMVPLRFIAESMETNVSWDSVTRTIRISTLVQQPPEGEPVAEGFYDPSRALTIQAAINPKVSVEVELEPGALTQAGQVRLYATSASVLRLVTDADVVTSYLPGRTGFDGARVKVRHIQKWPFSPKRPVIVANGEMLDCKCFVGSEVMVAGCRIVERDTILRVEEATDAQWAKVEIAY